MADRQLVVFRVNGEDFGIDITNVMEITPPQQIFKVPNTPEFIEGLINLRGQVHSVFNLRKKFHYPVKDFDDRTKIIMVNINGIAVGFIVDDVDQILQIDNENIENTPEHIAGLNRRYLSSVAKVGEKIILMLDLEYILTGEEADAVAELAAQ